MNIKATLIRAARAGARVLAGNYELWRIYSIAASQCSEPDQKVDIRPIDDLEIFKRSGLEKGLQNANCHKPGALGYAAWSGNELDGVCWFWPGHLLGSRNVGEQPDDCAELTQITVAQRAQGRGIGSALISFGGQQLQRAGFRRLYAQIWLTNKASVRAFEKAGWTQVAWYFQFEPPFSSRKVTCRWAFRKEDSSGNDVLSNWRVRGNTKLSWQ